MCVIWSLVKLYGCGGHGRANIKIYVIHNSLGFSVQTNARASVQLQILRAKNGHHIRYIWSRTCSLKKSEARQKVTKAWKSGKLGHCVMSVCANEFVCTAYILCSHLIHRYIHLLNKHYSSESAPLCIRVDMVGIGGRWAPSYSGALAHSAIHIHFMHTYSLTHTHTFSGNYYGNFSIHKSYGSDIRRYKMVWWWCMQKEWAQVSRETSKQQGIKKNHSHIPQENVAGMVVHGPFPFELGQRKTLHSHATSIHTIVLH